MSYVYGIAMVEYFERRYRVSSTSLVHCRNAHMYGTSRAAVARQYRSQALLCVVMYGVPSCPGLTLFLAFPQPCDATIKHPISTT